ncbi:hypothetical protein AUK40_06575 [Candidatus Wirthbacteria bacterium CG2_30_54_11]|uniref:Glycosyltransferase RgtA/B/C/D-like domain-containing protein n=1 Tax=Candidatus Wirthbacteria bacterium CG2_30_54_11 TaxID=1817892 RepID=A0A1J5ICM4_9BACT|nr:MAG: hypothetical protein AUK40_06575 [Candidatus Wirthbacteria bacterium CG2_30_54_11]
MPSAVSKTSPKSGWLFPFILFCFAGAFSLYPPLDPDLPWHLKVGQQIWKGQFPFADSFSHTMTGYRWVDHEWLTDALMFVLKSIGGYILLAIPFILAFLAAFYLAVRTGRLLAGEREPNKLLEFALGIWGLLTVNSVLGTRPQILSLLGFSAVLYILVLFFLGRGNHLKWLPLILLVWANLHGGYAIGLVLIFAAYFAVFSRWLSGKLGFFSLEGGGELGLTAAKPLAVAGFLSLVAVCINPYGPGLLYESFRTATDSYARTHIMEWLPVTITQTQGLLVFVMLGFALAGALIREITIPWFYYFFLLPLVYLGLSSYRHIPLLVLVLLPLIYLTFGSLKAVRLFFSETFHRSFAWKKGFFQTLLNLSLVVCLGGLLGMRGLEFVVYSLYQGERDQAAEQPAGAVAYLLDHPREGELFNTYGWGGYLIGRMDGVRVFIDGRMASWKSGDQHILETYYDIIDLQGDWQAELDRYSVTQVLLAPEEPLISALSLIPAWHETYRDDIAVIYEKYP